MGISFKKTIGNIPTKARVMLIITSILSVGAAYGFYKILGPKDSGNEALRNIGVGVKVSLNPEKDKIDKARPDDEVIIPEGSPLSKELSLIREKEIEDAKTRNGSFVEGLRLRNEERLISKLETELAKKSTNNGIDAILDEEIKEEENRRRKIAADRVKANERVTSARQVVPVTNTLFNEDEFLLKELEGTRYGVAAMEKSSLEKIGKLAALGSYEESGYKRKSADDNSGDSATTSNSIIITDDKNRISDLDKYRALANKKLINEKNGGMVQTQYESTVYPVTAGSIQKGQFITSGEIFYSVLEIGIDTDEISPVRATVIQSGILKGAVLIGRPSRVGEKAVIEFNKLALNGKDYSINVIAVDPETMRTGIADGVDRHTFERYFKLATAAVISGYSEALTGTTTRTYSDGSKEEGRNALPNASDQLAYAAGKVGEAMLPTFTKDFSRPPTITVNGNKELGIMFMEGLQL